MSQKNTPHGQPLPYRGEPLALPPSPHRLDLRPSTRRKSAHPITARGGDAPDLPYFGGKKGNNTPHRQRGPITLSSSSLHRPRRQGKHIFHPNFITPANPEQRVNAMLGESTDRFARALANILKSIRSVLHVFGLFYTYTRFLLRAVVTRINRFLNPFTRRNIDFAPTADRIPTHGSTLSHVSPESISAAGSAAGHIHDEALSPPAAAARGNTIPESQATPAAPARPRWYGGLLMRRKEAVAYFCTALTGLLALQVISSAVALQRTQGKVLGEATAGVQALMKAQSFFSHDDTNAALESFLQAEEKFSNASAALAEARFSGLFSRLPLFRSGSSLIAVGELASGAAEHILVAMKSLDEARTSFAPGSGVLMSATTDRDSRDAEPPATPTSPGTPSGRSPGSASFEQFTGVPLPPLQEASRHLGEASQALARADEYMGTIDAQYIPDRYRDAYATMGQVLSPASRLTARASRLLELITLLMGSNDPHRIVLIFQNDAELRPTGGFMGSFAYVDTMQGNITSLTVPGGGFYDFKGSMTARVDAPYPFHLFSPYWQPWNANYLFDFPSSARTIQWFIEKSQGPTVDAIVAVTPALLEDLLELTGPVVLPDYQLALTRTNVRRALQEEVEQRYDRARNQPKAVIGALLPVVIERLPQILKDDPARLMQMVAHALDRRDILMWSRQPHEQQLVQSVGWGGEAMPEDGDYLAVVHTNIGGGKTDRVMDEHWDRTITFDDKGAATAVFTLTRTHRGNTDDIFEKVHNVDYLRLFVPQGSELIDAQGFDEPEASLFKYEKNLAPQPELASIRLTERARPGMGVRTSEEHGFMVFGGWVMTKAGATSVVTVSYRLPPAIMRRGGIVQAALGTQRNYRLTIQRQPGALDVPFRDRLIAPAGWGAPYAEGSFQSMREGTILSLVAKDVRYGVRWGD